MCFSRRLFHFLFALFAAVSSGYTAEPDFFPGVKRIVFLGDSITHSGEYVDAFEVFLLLKFPKRRFEVLNLGLPSETVSGLSEEGHANGKFPRPDLHERLDRVLAKTKPDLVFACYGMNDGIYLPFDESRFAKFQDGIRRLREKVFASGAQIIHLTPPVFDPEPIRDRVAPAERVNADHPFEGYGKVLDRYAQWLIEQRKEGWRVIDIHGTLQRELTSRRMSDPKFTFAKDGVHPSFAGHAIIARSITQELAPDSWALVTVLGRDGPLSFGQVLFEKIRKRGRILTDAWLQETGHQRPGMQPGLPLAEAQARAAQLEKGLRVDEVPYVPSDK